MCRLHKDSPVCFVRSITCHIESALQSTNSSDRFCESTVIPPELDKRLHTAASQQPDVYGFVQVAYQTLSRETSGSLCWQRDEIGDPEARNNLHSLLQCVICLHEAWICSWQFAGQFSDASIFLKLYFPSLTSMGWSILVSEGRNLPDEMLRWSKPTIQSNWTGWRMNNMWKTFSCVGASNIAAGH